MYGSKQAQPCTNLGQDVAPEMPEHMSEFSYEEVRQAWNALNNSPVAHHVNMLDIVFEQNAKLTTWEVDQMTKLFEKFSAKYTSPLAKAME